MSPATSRATDTQHREIFILVNGIRVGPFDSDLVTGADIKTKAGLALDGELSKETEHGLVPIGNSEQIRIHENEHFKYVPPTPGSG